jgi:excisionase family DNA binding protein
MDDEALTLQEAADELGVHYMTAYRYVRLGLLDATKQGGVWRVRPVDVEAFRKGSQTSPVTAGEAAPWSERLESRLVAGDNTGAWGVIEQAMASGSELEEIYLNVLTPAMVSIGERWSVGELDIAIEHRASAMAMRLIGRIGPRFVRRGRSRGAVIIATPGGEHHALPVAMLSDLLRLEGWDVSDLGSNVPSASLVQIVRDTPDAVAIGLSVSSMESLAALREACSALRQAAPQLLIVVGGRAIQGRDHAWALGAHDWAVSGEEMSEFIEAHLAEQELSGGFA